MIRASHLEELRESDWYWRSRVCQSPLTGGFCRTKLTVDAGLSASR